MLPDLAIRSGMPELMDDPGCPEHLLLRTVRQFASINRLVSRYRAILKQWVLADMLKEPKREYHLLDMGAGGCDIDVWLLRKAKELNLNLRITACDLDERIIEYARSTYGDVEGLQIRQQDLLSRSPREPVDFVFANHFLHHLEEEDIARLLRLWHPHVRVRMVFSDLERNRAAYLGYSALSLFYRNSFARYDGLVSIRRGFKPDELESHARKTLPNSLCRARRLGPGRLVLCIEGNQTQPL